jgi:CBS domain-containing protein
MICPHCGIENIPGADDCDGCGHSLVDELQPASEVERSLMSDVLGQLDPKTPIVATPDTTVKDALKLIHDNSIGCVLIVDGEKLVGIFSERDALVKVGSRFGELGDHAVSEFMTPDPQTLESSAKLAFAVQRMDVGGYRHVPVVDKEGNATGVSSVRDILKYLTAKMQG